MNENLFDTLIDIAEMTETAVKAGTADVLKDVRLSAGWLKDTVLAAVAAGDIARCAGDEIVMATRRLIGKLDAALGWD